MVSTPERMLLVGATSVVGYTLAQRYPERIEPLSNPHNRHAAARGWRCARLEEPEICLSSLPELPQTILYVHAVCDVSRCQASPAWARRVNVECLRRWLAVLPAETRFVYLSSDHVFGGDGVYRESSPLTPISLYGDTRVEAEHLVLARRDSLLIRVGLPIGGSLDGRTGFLDWLRYRQPRQLPLTIIHDEARSAVWSEDAAARILALAQSKLTGIRHIAATRAVGRPELATFLLRRHGLATTFTMQGRAEQSYPHIGHIELATEYDDPLSASLASVVDENDRIRNLPIAAA